MGGARVPGIVCWWCDISNCLGDHVIVVLGGFNESAFWIYKVGRSWFVSSSPSSPCLCLINTPMLCLLLVDLGPHPLLRLN